jgi:hypothetical protein
MKLNIGSRWGLLFWAGRRRDTPIVYDDLVDAETRAFEADEKRIEAEEKLAAANGRIRLFEQALPQQEEVRFERDIFGEALGLVRRVLEGTAGDGVPFIDDAVRNTVIFGQVMNESGDRLYHLLAIFDTRDGTPLAELVRTAREGWERIAMKEVHAWDDFDACWASLSAAQRSELGMARIEQVRKWERELSLRLDKAGPGSAAALYAQGVLRGLGMPIGEDAGLAEIAADRVCPSVSRLGLRCGLPAGHDEEHRAAFPDGTGYLGWL